ncbi:MAG: hypothetical protein K6A32_04875 [Bacteroidales bacterium]|nr:hypothetical protein [Bacteroidales bacterium]
MKKLMFTLMAAVLMSVPALAQNRTKYLSTTSASLDVSVLQTAEQPVQINRYLFAGYNTLCLPMTLSATQLQTAAPDVRVERLAAIRQEGATLCLYFLDCTSEGIQAGMPYLIYSPKTQNLRARTNDALLVDTELQSVTMSDNQGNRILFAGSWESLAGDAQRYGIPAKQDVEILESVLLPTSADKTFLPTRCGVVWLQQNATASQIAICHATGADVTAINAINGNSKEAEIYDLAGRRVSHAQRGVYVVDGKKKARK